MGLVVASSSIKNATVLPALEVITKPTGVAIGDLLILIAAQGTNALNITCPGFTSNKGLGNVSGELVGFQILSRIADASDVAATQYTVSGTSLIGMIMLRVTGWLGVPSLNPVHLSADVVTSFTTGVPTTVNSGAINLIMPCEQLDIMVMAFFGQTTNVFNTPSITPSAPTFTSLGEVVSTNAGSTRFGGMKVSYGVRTSTAPVTAYSFVSDASTSATVGVIGSLTVIPAGYHQKGTNALLEVPGQTFADAGVAVGATGTNALLEPAPVFPVQRGTGKRWTDKTVPATPPWTDKTVV